MFTHSVHPSYNLFPDKGVMKVFNFQKEAVEQKCLKITALYPGPRVSSLAIMSFHIVLVRGRTKYCLLL